MMDTVFSDPVRSGHSLSRADAFGLLTAPATEFPHILDETYRVRHFYHGNKVKLCMLLNAQSGLCPEDCSYCSQAKDSAAPIDKYRLMNPVQILEKAREAVNAGARRFCIVCSGTGPSEHNVDKIGMAVRLIKIEFPDLEICTSLGLMSLEKAGRLKEAGVGWINHNLNTSERFYPEICTTHTYQNRVETVENVREAGLSTCSGGIIGMGETVEDIVDLAFSIQKMNMDSIPINLLHSIDGTKLGGRPFVDPLLGLKMLCLVRLMNPSKEVRIAGGREHNLGNLQGLALYAANSIFIDGYLTTPGMAADETKKMVQAFGFEVEEALALKSKVLAPATF